MSLNRLLTILFVCVIVLSACDRDMSITEQLTMNAPNAEAEEPSVIPDWLKEKLWHDKETLIAELVALENAGTLGGTKINGVVVDTRPVTVLSNQLATRQLQDKIYTKWINAEGGSNHCHSGRWRSGTGSSTRYCIGYDSKTPENSRVSSL